MCIEALQGLENRTKVVATICYLELMLTREIQLDTYSGPVTLNPRWLRIPAAVKYSGLSRSRLYELLSDGKIRSICVKSQKWAQRGVRLIDRESIDLFMERQEFA
jgi:predicted DNA-binding transcriptional regulator AlpA